MRKLLVASLALFAIIAISGCYNGIPGLVVTGSGHKVTREVKVEDFDTVDASSTFDVTITRGDTYEVSLTGDDNFMEHLRADLNGSTLRLYVAPQLSGFRSVRLGTVEAHITMPDLREVRLSGASHGTIDGFTRDLDIKASGASQIQGQLNAGTVRLEASGASRASLDGSAQELIARGSGASNLDLGNLRSGNARVELSGGSSARVHVIGELDYDLSGGARLEYEGRPRVGQAETSGGASVRGN